VLLATTLLIAVLAQSQTPVFRARTDLVQLDVVVVDADGRAIAGLAAADFQILDNGRAQRVATVAEVSHSKSTANLFPPAVPRDVADNTRSAADRLVVVIMDDLHFQGKTEETKAMARRVVEEIADGAALAFVTTSGQFGVEPTTERAQVLAEIDRFADKFDPEGRRTVFGEVTAPEPGPIRNAIGDSVTPRGPKDLGTFFGNMTAFKTLQEVAKKIAADPSPRKTFLWISGGMSGSMSLARCDEGLKSESIYCSVQSSLLEALRNANVSAYPIDTGDFRSALLRDVAADSGGFVVKAANFDDELPRLISDLDHYYLLGFYPENAEKRGFHKLEVRVTRDGATVRHRMGYHAGAPKQEQKETGLGRLAERPLPVTDLPLRMHAAAAPAAGRLPARTVVALEVPSAAGTASSDTLRYEVWAIDLRKKKVVASVAREARVTVPAPYQVHTMLTLKPGRYQLRASAASGATAKGGSVFQALDVPDYRKALLEIGPVSVAYSGPQRVPVVRGGVGASGLFPIPVTLDREFSADDTIRLVCDVTGKATGPVDVEVDLLTAAGDRARRLLARPLTGAGPRTLEVALNLAGLAPGGYRVRIAAAAGAISASREIAIVVRP
jgi:VWFA-related protein